MSAAFQAVPSPVTDHRTDHAEDFLADVYRIGEAWTAQVGGWGGIHVQGKSGAYIARWGSHGGPTGSGACIADALLDLARKLSADLKSWAAEDEGDLAPILEASLAALRLGGV